MACVGPLRQIWKSRPTGAPGPRRLAIAWLSSAVLGSACFAAGPLAADEMPGSVIVDSASALRDVPTQIPLTTAFTLNAQQPPFWRAVPGLEPRFVAIDDVRRPVPVSGLPFGLSQSVPETGRWNIWTALGRWEAGLWRSERPTIVLTSAETFSVTLDEEAPLMPPDVAGIAPARTGMPPAPIGSDLQPIDGCVCPPIRFSDDAWAFLPRVGHDAWGLVNWDDAIILGVALGGSLALRGDVDQDVRNWTAEHPDRWGEGSKLIGDLGVVQYQIPVIFAAYAFTVWQQDDYEHQMMTSLISAYTLFGVSTLAIKVAADTKRPSNTWNGGSYGFPSWHDGSMFCMSAVIDEYEGHWIGVPLYILSGLVGWSRIDTRDHDLSDVVFGGVLGYVIGKSVAGRALYGDSRVHILPYVHPSEGSAGVMFDATF